MKKSYRCIQGTCQGTWNGDLVVLDRALSKSIVEGVEDEMNHEREVGLDFWSGLATVLGVSLHSGTKWPR